MIICFFYKERVCAYMYIYLSARITQVTLSRNVIFFILIKHCIKPSLILGIILESQKLTARIKWKLAVLVPHLFPWPDLEKLFKDTHNNLSFKLEMLSVEMGF